MPLTGKGEKILSHMKEEYGSEEKAKQVLYAGKNKGTFTGIDCDKIGRIADAVNNLAQRFDAIVDADNEWHVQFKTRDKSGKEHNESRNVKASTASEAERKAKEKDKHPDYEFVRILSARQGPAGYGS
jgi:SHS2 domain-containing protein